MLLLVCNIIEHLCVQAIYNRIPAVNYSVFGVCVKPNPSAFLSDTVLLRHIITELNHGCNFRFLRDTEPLRDQYVNPLASDFSATQWSK